MTFVFEFIMATLRISLHIYTFSHNHFFFSFSFSFSSLGCLFTFLAAVAPLNAFARPFLFVAEFCPPKRLASPSFIVLYAEILETTEPRLLMKWLLFCTQMEWGGIFDGYLSLYTCYRPLSWITWRLCKRPDFGSSWSFTLCFSNCYLSSSSWYYIISI